MGGFQHLAEIASGPFLSVAVKLFLGLHGSHWLRAKTIENLGQLSHKSVDDGSRAVG